MCSATDRAKAERPERDMKVSETMGNERVGV
jgi:hypothetical protein